MARHHQRAAGVGEAPALLPGGAREPALEEAGEERVARAEHVHHLDREPGEDRRVLDASRDLPLDDGAARGAELHHEDGGRRGAHRAQGADEPLLAAGDAELLLGADHQVEERQDGPAGAR